MRGFSKRVRIAKTTRFRDCAAGMRRGLPEKCRFFIEIRNNSEIL